MKTHTYDSNGNRVYARDIFPDLNTKRYALPDITVCVEYDKDTDKYYVTAISEVGKAVEFEYEDRSGDYAHTHTFNDSMYVCDECGVDIKEL